MPDAKTVWLYRKRRAQAGLVEELFRQFDGYIARGGQSLDASIVAVPRNHNTREGNKTIKGGEVPEGWADKPAKRCGCALYEKARQKPLRLQEPRQRGPTAQSGAPLSRDRCRSARQPGGGSPADAWQYRRRRPGGTLVRTVGIARAKAKIGMKTITYNMRRLVQLRRINPCPA